MNSNARRPLSELVLEVRRTQDASLAQRKRRSAAEQLVAMRARRHGDTLEKRRQVPQKVVAALGLGALVVAAIAILIGRREAPPAPLAFTFGTSRGVVGEWLAPENREEMRFSDGSSVSLDRGASLRVVALTSRGATMSLERGVVETHVVPREGNAWTLAAGPFEIHVKGTRFETEWKPQERSLRVTMREGKVVVVSPCLAGPQALSGNESATIRCDSPASRSTGEGLSAVPSLPPIQERASASTSVVPAYPLSAISPTLPTSASAPRTIASVHWTLATQGLPAREALALIPVEEVLAGGDLLAVSKLADLARRASAISVAERAYRKLRAEGGAGIRSTATFMLARLLLDTGRIGEGASLLESYDAEFPSGPFAEEALARRLEIARAAGGSRMAHIAKLYLARFPQGPYATTAKNLLEQ